MRRGGAGGFAAIVRRIHFHPRQQGHDRAGPAMGRAASTRAPVPPTTSRPAPIGDRGRAGSPPPVLLIRTLHALVARHHRRRADPAGAHRLHRSGRGRAARPSRRAADVHGSMGGSRAGGRCLRSRRCCWPPGRRRSTPPALAGSACLVGRGGDRTGPGVSRDTFTHPIRTRLRSVRHENALDAHSRGGGGNGGAGTLEYRSRGRRHPSRSGSRAFRSRTAPPP